MFRIIWPLDKKAILGSVAKTNRVVIVHEDHRTLSIGAEVSAVPAEEAFDCLDAPIVRLGLQEVPAIPASGPRQNSKMLSVEKIMTALRRTAEY